MTYLKIIFDFFKKLAYNLIYINKIPIIGYNNFFITNFKKIHFEIIILFNNFYILNNTISNKNLCLNCKKIIKLNYFINNNINKFIKYKRIINFWVVSSDR